MLALLLMIETAQEPLNLTCFGGGTANKSSYARAWSSEGSVNFLGKRQQGFEDQVDIRLFDGDDRIRMPRTMLPPIRGGKDGWFKLKDVEADSRSIRAHAAVALLSNPKVHIDRVTGTISISGRSGDYVGQCEVIDSQAPPKF